MIFNELILISQTCQRVYTASAFRKEVLRAGKLGDILVCWGCPWLDISKPVLAR